MQKVVRAVYEDYTFDNKVHKYLEYDGMTYVEEANVPYSLPSGQLFVGSNYFVSVEEHALVINELQAQEKELKRLRRLERRAHKRWEKQQPLSTEIST